MSSNLNYIQNTEPMAGAGGGYSDTLNRALRNMLSLSGYNPDATTFSGLPGPVFNLMAFGAVGNGAANDTNAMNAAIAAAYAAGGGTVWCPRTHRIDGQILIPNDGASTPTQPPIRITGAATGSGAGQTLAIPATQGILDLRYSGADGKIVTLGLGTLQIDHLYIKDLGTSSTPYILTTNTTLKIHHNRFDGNPSKSQLTCDQDAVVCGGTTPGASGGTVNNGFQGYGTVIESNAFNRIRRALYGKVYANGIVFEKNWLQHGCGTNLANGAAVEFVGDGTDRDTGNIIEKNVVEIYAYPYFVKLTNAVQNSILHNGLFDPSATTIAGVRVETASTFNLVIPGYSAGSKPAVSEIANGGTTVYQHDQSLPSVMQGFTTQGQLSSFTDNFLPFTKNAAGDSWNSSIAGTNGTVWDWGYTPVATGVRGQAMALTQVSTTDFRLRFMGTTGNRVESLVGPMDIRTLAGQSLILGDTAKFMNITNGILGSNVTAGTAVFALAAKINAVTGSRRGVEAHRVLLNALATAGLITDSSVAGNTAVAYSAAMTIDASTTDVASITATNGTAFTINAPTNPQANMRLRVRIRNTSGGALGVATWNAVFKMTAWTQPATGFSRSIDFDYDGTNWVEAMRSAADVPN